MKTPTTTLTFPPFRLDPANACLWRGTKRLALPPKDFAILHYLVTHAGQLVTHEDLLKAVWPDTIVSAKGLKAFVRRLRQTVGDKAAKPRFIETVHGQGYRFVAAVTAAPISSSEFKVQSSPSTPNPQHPAPALVGRETELAQLHGWLDKAANGHRQLVFVTGEPGIGKTTLVESFLYGLAPREQEESQRSKVKAQKSKVSETQPSVLGPRLPPAPGLPEGNASSSTVRVNRTCRCWTR